MNYLLLFIILLSSIVYLVMYVSTYKLYKYNKSYINQQLKDNKSEIEIIKYPYFISCNLNPENQYHEKKFKEYYHIPESKKLKLIENNWKFRIIYEK